MEQYTSPGTPVNTLNSPRTIFSIQAERGGRNNPQQTTNHNIMPLQFSIYTLSKVTGKLIREKVHGQNHQQIGYRQDVLKNV